MSEVVIFVVAPPAGAFLLLCLLLHAVGKLEPELCGPPRKAGTLSQAFFSEERVLQVMSTVVVLTAMSIVVAYRSARTFAYTAEPVAILASTLALLAVVLEIGSILRLRDFPSTRVRIAAAVYGSLAVALLMVPDLLQICSYQRCWYPPFDRPAFRIA